MNNDAATLTPRDLPDWHRLTGYCGQCGHEGGLDPRRLPQDQPLDAIEGRLICAVCGNRLGNYLEVGAGAVL